MLERLVVASVLWRPEVCLNAFLQVSAITAFSYTIFNGSLSDGLYSAQAHLLYFLKEPRYGFIVFFLMDPAWYNVLTPPASQFLSSLFNCLPRQIALVDRSASTACSLILPAV